MTDQDYIARLAAIWPPVLIPGSPEAQDAMTREKAREAAADERRRARDE